MKSMIASLVAALALVPAVAHAGDLADRKGVVGIDFELLPTGTIRYNFGGGTTTNATADTAYGVGMLFEDQIDDLVSVGLAPRYILNVKDANSNGDAAAQLDLRARVAVGGKLIPKLRVYGFAEPGWSVLFPPSSVQVNNNHVHPNGFCLDVGGGVALALAHNVRGYFELGYQWGFQSWDASGTVLGQTVTVSGDDKTEYLQLGFGIAALLD